MPPASARPSPPPAIEAARTAADMLARMQDEGRPLLQRILAGEAVDFWTHYPPQDARDEFCKARWYYHAHAPGSDEPGEERGEEHGHFHLFLHRTQLPAGLEPKVWPPQGEDCKAHVTHLAALSIDQRGLPCRWFTVNRFVTNEFLYPAEVMIAHLPLFNVDHTEEDALVNRFVTAMVALYRDEIAQLLRERDARHAQLVKALGQRDAYEKESGVEVLSALPTDWEGKLRTLRG